MIGIEKKAIKILCNMGILFPVTPLIAIIKKRLGLKQNLYTILQILSLSLFEKYSLYQIVTGAECTNQTE